MSLLSKATVGTVGLLCKTFLRIGYCSSVSVNGLENLFSALESDERNAGRGVVTISNHISTLDDPLVWGVLPLRYQLDSRMTRWTLGASDIMFTNPIFSAFFRKGQVIETFRGNGLFQPAIDLAIRKLNSGAWIHLFGEGKVNQLIRAPGHSPVDLIRFKWGIGRILMETMKPPIIIPMWLTGFDQLMPEGRSAPWKFLPRPGAALSITFGKPVDNAAIRETLNVAVNKGDIPELPQSTHGGRKDPVRPHQEEVSARVSESGWLGGAASPRTKVGSESETTRTAEWRAAEEIARIRSAVTALLQRKVEELGKDVVGKRV
ncbi:acyltransferase-domain-containing protein [Rhodofomes roseus]|uniref:Tafazzin family protein n=1 Tax=Rhodofomes roseus TaxID=34475 RepID=A0ABQ8KQE3_9APHY|nr:acyltransferase-domain-containing protein [Rhodofomes roseus]KAH9840643.1 acyltransferase-domain-containing protein [Rhodofomes roseus]